MLISLGLLYIQSFTQIIPKESHLKMSNQDNKNMGRKTIRNEDFGKTAKEKLSQNNLINKNITIVPLVFLF